MFRRQRLLFAQLQHLFDRSNFFRHVKLLQTLLTSRVLAADGILMRRIQNSTLFSTVMPNRGDGFAVVNNQRPGIISSRTPLKYSVSGIVGTTGWSSACSNRRNFLAERRASTRASAIV